MRPKLDWMWMAALGAYSGLSVSFLTPVFNHKSRWVFLFLAFLFMVGQNRWRHFRHESPVALAGLAFLAWALLTAAWSEVPLFSFAKASILTLASLTFLLSAYSWVLTQADYQKWWDYLALAVAIAFVGAIGGVVADDAGYQQGLALYYGAVGSANRLGIMLASASPFLAWKLWSSRHHPRSHPRVYYFWGVVSLVGAYYLIQSNSRASIIVVLCVIFGALLGSGIKRRLTQLIALAFLSVSIALLSPGATDELSQRFLYKYGDSVFHSRENVWEYSWEQAIKGGVWGGGYGVTIGAEEVELTYYSAGYGREKGNSQLAILEEMGWVGVIFYLVFLLMVARSLLRGWRAAFRREQKVQLGIAMGIVAGMVFHSVFEGWWQGPGSYELAYFLSVLGGSLAIARRVRLERRWEYRAIEAGRGKIAHDSDSPSQQHWGARGYGSP